MALQDGFPSASGLADANDVRLALAGLIVRDSSGNPRTGIFLRNTTALVTSTATMNSSVAAFEAALSRSGQGVILLPNNGATNVLHDAAPVSNARYDTIYVKQNDAVSPNADANNLPVFGILKGTASVSPTLPTYATAKTALDAAAGIGAGAEPLATVLIPSTATSMQSSGVVYTQLHQYTASSGGVVPFRNKAALDLWTTASEGQEAYSIADATTFRRVAGVWVLWSTAGGWKDYIPTISGFTLVGGVFVISKFKVDAGLVTVKIRAAVQSMVSNPLISLPVAPSDGFTEHLPGTVALIPGAGSEAVGMARKSGSSVTFFSHLVSGSTVYINNISASVPIAWGSTGTIAGIFSYESA